MADATSASLRKKIKLIIDSIEKKEISELMAYAKPPPGCAEVSLALAILLGFKSDGTWKAATRMFFGDSREFGKRLMHIDEWLGNLSDDRVREIREALKGTRAEHNNGNDMHMVSSFLGKVACMLHTAIAFHECDENE